MYYGMICLRTSVSVLKVRVYLKVGKITQLHKNKINKLPLMDNENSVNTHLRSIKNYTFHSDGSCGVLVSRGTLVVSLILWTDVMDVQLQLTTILFHLIFPTMPKQHPTLPPFHGHARLGELTTQDDCVALFNLLALQFFYKEEWVFWGGGQGYQKLRTRTTKIAS